MATTQPYTWLTNLLKYTFKGIGYALGALIIAIISLLAVLYSPAGGQRIAQFINSQQSSIYLSGIHIKNGGIYIPDLRLMDSQGQWLRARHTYVVPDYSKLTNGIIALKPSFIRELSILRQPDYPQDTQPRKKPRRGKVELSKLIPHVDIKQFNINNLYIQQPILAQNKRYSLQAKALINPSNFSQSFVETTIKHKNKNALQLILNNNKTQFKISQSFGRDIGYILTKNNVLISASLNGNYTTKDWQGTLKIQAENLWQLQQQIRVTSYMQKDVVGIQSSGNIKLNNNNISLSYNLNLHANINKNSLFIKGAHIAYDGLKIQSKGQINLAKNTLDIDTSIMGSSAKFNHFINCPNCAIRNVAIKTQVTGNMNNPKLSINGQIEKIQAAQASATNTTIKMPPSFLNDLQNFDSELRTNITILPNLSNAQETSAITGPFHAIIRDGIIKINSYLTGIGTDFTAKATYPLPSKKIPEPKLSGLIKGQLDLTPILTLFPTPQFRAGGELTIDASLAGTAQKPVITGDVALKEGFFEHLIYGTKLQNINAQANWQDDHLNIQKLSLTDGGRGTLTGGGSLQLKTTQDLSYSLNLSADQMRLIDSGSISAVSSGDLALKGSQGKAILSGDVTIHRARLYLMQLPIGSKGFSDYEITDTNAPQASSDQTTTTKVPFNLTLDIAISSKGNIIARAQGFESDWGADLKVTGYARDPQLNGILFLRRGELEIASLMVELTRGDIRFYGNPTNPSLDIRGVIDGQGTDATLIIGGQAKVPTFRLTSDSNLPEEELLSQVLFGESASNLSPFQAIQIAQVIAGLRGKGGNFNPLAELRRKTGLDTLSVNYDDATGGSSLEAGKYISDKVYISIEQGTVPGSSAVSGEIEINDRLSIETSIGGASQDTKAGLKWRWDY